MSWNATWLLLGLANVTAFGLIWRWQGLVIDSLARVSYDVLATKGGDVRPDKPPRPPPDADPRRPQPVELHGGLTLTHVLPPGHDTETLRLLHDLLNQVSIIETQIAALIAAVAALTEDPTKLQQVSTQLAALKAKAEARTAAIKETIAKNT